MFPLQFYVSDTSKKRAAYRAKIDREKTQLTKKLVKLRQVDQLENHAANAYDMHDMLKGVFPWQITGIFNHHLQSAIYI